MVRFVWGLSRWCIVITVCCVRLVVVLGRLNRLIMVLVKVWGWLLIIMLLTGLSLDAVRDAAMIGILVVTHLMSPTPIFELSIVGPIVIVVLVRHGLIAVMLGRSLVVGVRLI